jgi:hypothetical protein
VLEKKFCPCLIKGEKTNKKNYSKPKQINPMFKCNKVSVSPSASSPNCFIVSSKERKTKKKKKKRERVKKSL